MVSSFSSLSSSSSPPMVVRRRLLLLLAWLLCHCNGSFMMVAADGPETTTTATATSAAEEEEETAASCDCTLQCEPLVEAEKATAVQQSKALWEAQVKKVEMEMQGASREWEAVKQSYETEIRRVKEEATRSVTTTEGHWKSKVAELETARRAAEEELRAQLTVEWTSKMAAAQAEAEARTQQEMRQAHAAELRQAQEAARVEQVSKLQDLQKQLAQQMEEEKAAMQKRVSVEASETRAALVQEAEAQANARYDEMVKNYEAKLQAANFRSSAYKSEQEEWEEKYRTAAHELRELREEGRKTLAKEKVVWQAQVSQLEKQVDGLEAQVQEQEEREKEWEQQVAAHKDELEAARKDSAANVYCNLERLSSHLQQAAVEVKDWLFQTVQSSEAMAWLQRRVVQPVVTHSFVASVLLPVAGQVSQQAATQSTLVMHHTRDFYNQHLKEHVEPSLAVLRNAVESLYISAIFGVEMASDTVAAPHVKAREALELQPHEQDSSVLRSLILAACHFGRNNAEPIVQFCLAAFAILIVGPLLLECLSLLLWCLLVWPFQRVAPKRRVPPAPAKKSSSPPAFSSKAPAKNGTAAKNGTKPGSKPSQRTNGGKRTTKKES